MTKNENIIKTSVFVITISLGFLPFLIFSILTQSFWINSKYDFPLVLIPNILIGDSILLPIFNKDFFGIINNLRIMEIIKREKKRVLFFLIVFSILSIIINSYTHWIWVNDKYTGFMDFGNNNLTIAGWWHLFFSIFEMTIIFLFVYLWYVIKKKENPLLYLFKNTWKTILCFNSLAFIDLLLKVYVISPGIDPILIIESNLLTLIPFLISSSIYLFL